jgi:hypothetical protein
MPFLKIRFQIVGDITENREIFKYRKIKNICGKMKKKDEK